MKRSLLFTFVLALGIFFAAESKAQSFSWGIDAGMNLTKLKLDGGGTDAYGNRLSSSNRAGWYVGPKISFSSGIGLGFNAAIQYSERYLDINDKTETYRSFEIPVNLVYSIGLGDVAKVYASTGPQFGFAINNMSWSNFGSGTNFSTRNLNTTWNVGAGVRLFKHLDVGVGYNFALSHTGKAIFENFGGDAGGNVDYRLKYKTNTFQVHVAYVF
ncbi:MAG: outer membrane beta-barrel protein [Alloprevotella sp.]